jgi:hypothetical protein
MPGSQPQKTQRRIRLFFGLVLAAIFYMEFSHQDYQPVLAQHSAIVLAEPRVASDPFERLLRQDPLSALLESRRRHVREVTDYRCTMIKQELLGSGMSAEQEIEVRFRQEPYSVMMEWVRNAGLASRVLYVRGKWTDPQAEDPTLRELAVCQPGAVAKLFVKSIKMPIHGSMARRTARRSIDEFGFGRTLDLLIKYCQIAKSRDELRLTFRGSTHFDGRPVWVIRRHLPYTGEAGIYPDRSTDIFIDQEYYVPVAVYCYSDEDHKPTNLLGKYEYRDIRFNVGLTPGDFEPGTYGM